MPKTYIASRDFIHRKVAGANVLISVGGNVADFNGYVELNDSALSLWNALQAPCSLDDLYSHLEKTYQIDHETAMKDVDEFMSMLIEHQMVEEQ